MIVNIKLLLAANSNLTALVSDRIYGFSDAPADVQSPYVTWFLVNGSPQNLLSETPVNDYQLMQIDCWAKTGQQCVDLATAVRNALEPVSYLSSYGSTEKEADTGLYRFRLDFDFILIR